MSQIATSDIRLLRPRPENEIGGKPLRFLALLALRDGLYYPYRGCEIAIQQHPLAAHPLDDDRTGATSGDVGGVGCFMAPRQFILAFCGIFRAVVLRRDAPGHFPSVATLRRSQHSLVTLLHRLLIEMHGSRSSVFGSRVEQDGFARATFFHSPRTIRRPLTSRPDKTHPPTTSPGDPSSPRSPAAPASPSGSTQSRICSRLTDPFQVAPP